jgi:hypothetical protein
LIVRDNITYSLLLDDYRMLRLVDYYMIWTNIRYFCVNVFMLCSQIYFWIITILVTNIRFTINWELKLWRYGFNINLYAIISCVSTLQRGIYLLIFIFVFGYYIYFLTKNSYVDEWNHIRNHLVVFVCNQIRSFIKILQIGINWVNEYFLAIEYNSLASIVSLNWCINICLSAISIKYLNFWRLSIKFIFI